MDYLELAELIAEAVILVAHVVAVVLRHTLV